MFRYERISVYSIAEYPMSLNNQTVVQFSTGSVKRKKRYGIFQDVITTNLIIPEERFAVI